jgi:hypothetical protein
VLTQPSQLNLDERTEGERVNPHELAASSEERRSDRHVHVKRRSLRVRCDSRRWLDLVAR